MTSAQFSAEWDVRGPKGGFEAYYRAAAESMVAAMVDVIAVESGTYDDDEWTVQLAGRQITVKPDRVVIGADGTVHIQRIRTGRKTKSEPNNRFYALLRQHAAVRYRGRRVSIETYYLATRETVVVLANKEDEKLAEYTDAIAAIERGTYAPPPEDVRRCPSCPCYFVCDFVQGVS